MKAIICTDYGSPDVMQLREVQDPACKSNEVLIKIHAATVTAGDCQLRSFEIPALFWIPLRLYLGIIKPRKGILGQELAGIVESVGTNVKRFRKGDNVFAFTMLDMGAYAGYISLPERHITAFNPEKMTAAQAATIPTGGINGLHFIRKANIRAGEQVLINGAGGSIGTYALQFARSAGAKVTCVDSAAKLPMLISLGADEVIDYTQEDFTQNGKTYDVIIDVVGTSPYSPSIRSLTSAGRYVLGNPTFSGMLRAISTSVFARKKVFFEFASYKAQDLLFIRDEIEAGRIKPVIDRYFPLEQTPEAHRYVDAGLKCGNVVITI